MRKEKIMNDLTLTSAPGKSIISNCIKFGRQSEEHKKILYALREIASWNSFAESLIEQIANNTLSRSRS